MTLMSGRRLIEAYGWMRQFASSLQTLPMTKPPISWFFPSCPH